MFDFLEKADFEVFFCRIVGSSLFPLTTHFLE